MVCCRIELSKPLNSTSLIGPPNPPSPPPPSFFGNLHFKLTASSSQQLLWAAKEQWGKVARSVFRLGGFGVWEMFSNLEFRV